MNDLRALVEGATPEHVSGLDGVLARRNQRSRRRRGLVAGASGTALAVGIVAVLSMSGPSDDQGVPPPPAATSAPAPSSVTPTAVDRPPLRYTYNEKPSPVVIRLPDRDVAPLLWLGCWAGPDGHNDCVEELSTPVAALPDVGSPEGIDFWFGVKGWMFDATFNEIGVDCPRSERTKAVRVRSHWFHLDPAGLAGDYRVDLNGVGPHGGGSKGVPTALGFVWHTPVDGPVDQPRARVGDSELKVDDLGFEPSSASAQVTITDANGMTTTRRLPRSGTDNGCVAVTDADRSIFDSTEAQGGLYFAGDFDDPAIPKRGPGPYTYTVRLTLDGTLYVGTSGPGHKVTWTPPLPTYGAR
jgi:hypothetical protein